MKVFVVQGGVTDMAWIDDATLTVDIENADVILFTGGEDVTPSLYGEPAGANTSSNFRRDAEEQEIFNKYVGKIPIMGICRGSQFICAMSGGKLIQDMRHPALHKITTIDGEELIVNSTHHQMMYPFEVNHTVLGWANISPYHLGGDNMEMEIPKLNGKAIEPEVVWFPDTMCLGIQSHPEYMGYPVKTSKWLNELISQYVKSSILQTTPL